MGKRLLCLLLSVMLLLGMVPASVMAVTENTFVLVAEAKGTLVIAPEYVAYTEGQTIREVLASSGHEFTGLEAGMVSAIDGVVGNFTRSDEFGDFALDKQASAVKFFRFSEAENSQPSTGLQQLMTAMADYQLKGSDVQAAAKDAYDTAYSQFVGIDSDSAALLAKNLNNAISDYEQSQTGARYKVTFTDGSNVHSGVAISAENAYGKVWTDDGDGILELPVGNYVFKVSQNGLQVSGSIVVSGDASFVVKLPEEQWLKTDTFRLSGSYGAENNEEHKFTDAEFSLGEWSNRQATVLVPDMFVGAVYAYAEYDASKLGKVPNITAIYTMTSTGETMEKKLAFESWTSGAYEVLGKGAEGNTIVYRLTYEGADGYTYAQDYTVRFDRIPTLTSITVEDQDGTDQAATYAFSGDVKEYTYEVLDTTTSVAISATGLEEDYSITVNGKPLTELVEVPVNGETTVKIVVSARGYSNTYILTIAPGEGKTLSFLSDKSVSIEVVNSNGMVMPFTTHRETDTQNRYKYTLVPGETYSYIATKDTYYHIADDFRLEDVANSTINVDFADMGDWLSELSFGTFNKSSYKNSLPLNSDFDSSNHRYEVVLVDTEFNPYIWVVSDKTNVSIEAVYNQISAYSQYHKKERRIELVSGKNLGTNINRFLLDENPYENTLIIQMSKEENGVTYYQDYEVEFHRALTMKDLTAKCDGATVILTQADGTNGFASDVKEYSVTVSMAAEKVELKPVRYTDNTSYGEEDIGYCILVDGVDVTQTGMASIDLDGTIQTQTVTIVVENDKAPKGSATYTINIKKAPPVEVAFTTTPAQAQLTIYEVMSGERLWPDSEGIYQLCEGYSYSYTLTEYGYVGRYGTLTVTHDRSNALAIIDGEQGYAVQQSGDGGKAKIAWTLNQAPANSSINTGLGSSWPNFRGSDSNNAVTSIRIPVAAEEGTLYWANQIGSGFDSDAVGSPILVGGDIITYASDQLFRVDTVTGKILATGYMDHKSSFSITPPTYAEGMVFVALSDGCVQAFNATTLESLWIYKDSLGGQPNCPLTVKDGYLYTGFWNSETGDANFVCLSITDEDPAQEKERKPASWYFTSKGGYYWAGAYAGDGFVLVGTDDGDNSCVTQNSSLLLLEAKTGRVLDRCDNLNGDIRSTIVYDSATDAYYFTSKGGSFYSFQVSRGTTLINMWSVPLQNGTGCTPMSTCSPVVYNGRAYIGVSGAGQFTAYSGHNITVVDLASRSIAYRVKTQGYPQTSGLLTCAYEAESGYVYVYFFDNYTPGKLRVLRDKAGQTSADYVTTENGFSTAYALFTPTGDQAQYAICSPIVDEYGTIYFKNDAAYLMAFGSAIERIEVTTLPNKMTYAEGERFDPTGMVVTATYANGKTRDITKYVTYSADTLAEGNCTVTISFEYVMYHNAENGTAMTAGVESVTPATTLKLTIGSEENKLAMGDVNMDGEIDVKDANLVVSWYYGSAELNEEQKAVADVNGDGEINVKDANLIVSCYYGTIDALPAES